MVMQVFEIIWEFVYWIDEYGCLFYVNFVMGSEFGYLVVEFL